MCRPVLQILTLFHTKKCWKWPQNSTLNVYFDRNYVIFAEIKTATKRFLKIHVEFAYYTFVLIHLELKRPTHWYTTVVPSLTIPDSRPKSGKYYPFSDQNGAKTPHFVLGRHIPIPCPGIKVTGIHDQ